MKKHLLIVICAALLVAFTSISLLVYIDLFKPSIHGAEKAFNNQEYQKAESIYLKVLESRNERGADIDAVIGLSKAYLAQEKHNECELLLERYYNTYPNSRRIIKRLSKFYCGVGNNEKHKSFLIDLYNRKSKKFVDKYVVKPKAVTVSEDHDAIVPINNNLYQLMNSFRDISVNISTDNNKQDIENIVKSSILFNNLDIEADVVSKSIFDNYGHTFNSYVNSDNYRAIDLEQAEERVLNLYDFNKFVINEDSFIYRIIEDKSGLPDVFKYNDLIFAKYSLVDRETVFFPVVELVKDKMNGKYVIEGCIYKFVISDYDVSDLLKPYNKQMRKDYKNKREVMSLYNNWTKKMSITSAKKLVSYSERISRFQTVLRQTSSEDFSFKVVSYKTK